MKTVVIIYSKTGNTRAVALKLAHSMYAEVLEVKAVSDDPNILIPELVVKPSVEPYEHLVFASPVHGFSLSKIMEVYLKGLPDLTGKSVDLFVTHYFPFAWMGGNRALKQMKLIVESKNGVVGEATSINWSNRKRDSDVISMIEKYTKL